MSIPDFLTPAYLETAIKEADKLKQYETPALNLFFSRKTHAPNGFVKVPKEIFNYNDILPLVEKGAAIPQSELNISREYTTYHLKLFGDLKVLNPIDIKRALEQVAHLTGDTYASKRAEIANSIIEGFNNKVNATREFMACSALAGSIKDKDGNDIETFDIPAKNKIAETSIKATKLFLLLDDMRNKLKTATKYKGKVALVLGKEAHRTILESDEYQKWLDKGLTRFSAQESLTSVEGFLGSKDYPYILLDDEYMQKGVAKPFFNPKAMMMIPVGVFAEFYDSIETNEGSFAKLKHIDNFKQNNPDGIAFRLQSGSMPIVTLPNGIISTSIKA